MTQNYEQYEVPNGVPVKMWTNGVPVEDDAKNQLRNIARLPIVFKHVAVMPDVHLGIGATIGSVVPTLKAIIPAAVGVDLGCGMMACKTTLTASDLPDNLSGVRAAIERAVPVGMTPKRFGRDKGSWDTPPAETDRAWAALVDEFDEICEAHPRIKNTNNYKHLGTLGTGNHFIEICLDEHQSVWVMLHSGSRGVGNAIGTHFIELAKKDAEMNQRNLPDKDLAYFEEGAQYFGDYVKAVGWAQKFAAANREVMDIIARRFNDVTHYRWGRIIDFLKLHYMLTQRDDNRFWIDNRDPATIPDRLRDLISLWRYQSPWFFDEFDRLEEVFPAASYQYVLYGMGFRTEVDPADTAATRTLAGRLIAENAATAKRMRSQLPRHRDLITKICEHGLQAI